MKTFPFLLFVFTTSIGLGQDFKSSTKNKATKCILEYPQKAVINNIQGIVEVKVIFDKECNIKEFIVVKSLGYGCDESAIKAVKCNAENIKRELALTCGERFVKVFPFTFHLD